MGSSPACQVWRVHQLPWLGKSPHSQRPSIPRDLSLPETPHSQTPPFPESPLLPETPYPDPSFPGTPFPLPQIQGMFFLLSHKPPSRVPLLPPRPPPRVPGPPPGTVPPWMRPRALLGQPQFAQLGPSPRTGMCWWRSQTDGDLGSCGIYGVARADPEDEELSKNVPG